MSSRRPTNSTPPPLTTLLDREMHVGKLTAHAERLLQLQRELEAALPKQLIRVVRVANFKLGKLVLHAANSAVAVKVRQILPGLLEHLRQKRAEVNEIEVKVQPLRTGPPKVKSEPLAGISDNAKQGLTALAQKLPPDAPLRQALERLTEKK